MIALCLFVLRLFKLEICEQKFAHAPPLSNVAPPGLNSTISLKETSEWLDNINPGDILVQEVITTETISERKLNEKPNLVCLNNFLIKNYNR